MPYYAVAVGKRPGIYSSWAECRANTDGYPNAIFKKFGTEPGAKAFLAEHSAKGGTFASVPAASLSRADPPGRPLLIDRVAGSRGHVLCATALRPGGEPVLQSTAAAAPEPGRQGEEPVQDLDASSAAAAPGQLPLSPFKDGKWWWQGASYRGRSAPFPDEFRCFELKSDRSQYRYDYDYLAPAPPGCAYAFTYKGQVLTAEQARALRAAWACRYCNVPGARDNGNGRESVQQRIKGTSSKEVRERVFMQLKDLEEYKQVPPPWNQKYRLDPFGNIVCLEADTKSSICGFQVDHTFPWSKGGLTVPENLVALFWRANTEVKKDRILDANEDDFVSRMQCGLKLDHFLHIIKRREGMSQRAAECFDRLVDAILCTPLPIEWDRVPGLEAEQLYRYLRGLLDAAFRELDPEDPR